MCNNKKDSLPYNSFASPEVTKFIELLEHPNVQSFLKLFFDNSLVTSEMKVLKRLADIERTLGLNGMDDEDQPTVTKKIEQLEEKIENIEFRPAVSPVIETIPTTKTEMRASLLVDALKGSGKDHYTAPEIMNFLKCRLPESCKIDENVQNIRKVKQDVVRKATEMFSHVKMNKKTTGHKDVRLILSS